VRTQTLRSVVYLSAGIGLIVSIFAAVEYFEASLRTLCTLNAFFSCSAVDTSGKTSTFGIPDYLWGIGGFVLILVVAGIAEARSRDRRWTLALLAFTTLGVALSLYFLYVQLAEIGAFCVVCASAYVFGWIAWGGALGLAARSPRGAPVAEAEDRDVSDDRDA